jgi:hypothetical protein
MAVHVFLHWRWITRTINGGFGSATRLRATLASFGLVLILGLVITPYFSSVTESGEQPPCKGRLDEATPKTAAHINGSMTLKEIE